MQSLNSFLNPRRKENLKFILSSAFVDDNGKEIEWEMRQLSASEGIELQKQVTSNDYSEVMANYVANSLVYPNLKDKQLLEGLSKKEGRPVLKAVDALKLMVTDSELASLISKYIDYNDLTDSFEEKVEDVKN